MSIEQEISEMSMEAAYNLFKVLLLDEEIGKKLRRQYYDKIRHGIDIEFDLYDYLENEYIMKGKQGVVIIDDQEVEKEAFRTEVENRDALLRKILIENLDEDDITEGRNIGDSNDK